jgi:hypothetical protein
MKDFRLVALMEFSKCEILMLGKFVSFFASCTLCIAEEFDCTFVVSQSLYLGLPMEEKQIPIPVIF